MRHMDFAYMTQTTIYSATTKSFANRPID